MNAAEVVRQRAEALHLAACAEGTDPWDPYRFATAEAERRRIEVARVPAGDVRLHNGRALYDPDTMVILHEETGSPFLDAFLVAHELGHVEIEGSASPGIAAAPDPTRPAEAAPVGMDRVVDYGQKERREVLMDLFAREFLLPRSVARRLHLEDGLTATQIATRLGADFKVVALQLLDALLLPPVVGKEVRPREEKPLNPEQFAAARHADSPYLLEAGPGTGKTQTLVARVGHLLERGVDPASILVLTFSNKAAGELTERIAAKWPSAAAIWIGTFHAFGLDIVRRFHDRLGLPANPRLLDRTEAIELLEAEFPRLNLEHFRNLWDPTRHLAEILSAISRAKDEMTGPTRYMELAEAMRTATTDDAARVAARRCREVALVYQEYERLKAGRQCLDFGDLVMLPAALCADDVVVRDALQARHRHVLVDEYQDVNRASVALLKALVGSGKNLWAVGDARQSVYRFRGASPFNMSLFDKDFPGAVRGRLVVNYRSCEEITTAFEQFANAGMKVSCGSIVAFRAHRGPCGDRPEHREVPFSAESAAVADAVEEMRAAGFTYRDQAILCAGNDRLNRIADGLEALGIPVLHLGSLFERPEIKDLLCLLSLLVDPWGVSLVRVAAMADFRSDLADVEAVLASVRKSGGRPLGWRDGLASSPSPGLRAVAALFDETTPDTDPWNFLARTLLDRTRMAAVLATRPVQGRLRGIAIWQFLNFVRSQPADPGLPASRLLDRIRKLLVLSDERDLRQLPEAAQEMDAVRLMTIHGSKGLEFPVVHIPGLNQGALPRHHGGGNGAPPDGMVDGAPGSGEQVAKASHEEEQKCLFFVALSRAQDRLLLYSQASKRNGARWPPSPFLATLGATVAYRLITPSRTVPPTLEEAPVPVRIDGTLMLSDHQAELYRKCPRRFLYTHALRTGGRRSETPFTRMHSAVQAVVDWMLAQPDTPEVDAVDAHLAGLWNAVGPGDHGYSADYWKIAQELLSNLVRLRAGLSGGKPPPLRIGVQGGEIVVAPDDLVHGPSGSRRVRKVRTGHKRSEEELSIVAALLQKAAQRQFGACAVDLVHLADGSVTSIDMSSQQLDNRVRKVEDIVAKIRQGQFPADPDQGRDCPRCPAFFICGPVPTGSVDLKKILR